MSPEELKSKALKRYPVTKKEIRCAIEKSRRQAKREAYKQRLLNGNGVTNTEQAKEG